jgi:hypothetical protein
MDGMSEALYPQSEDAGGAGGQAYAGPTPTTAPHDCGAVHD